MKILHVISSGGMYGAEAVILNLSKALQHLGHEAQIGFFAHAAAPYPELDERARSEGVTTHALPCSGQFDPALVTHLRALVKAEGVQVVHAHGYKADIYAYWAMRTGATPLVATCHNWTDENTTMRLYGRLDRLALKRFQAVAAVSEDVGDRLLKAGLSLSRVRLIRNGVDDTEFAQIKRDRVSPPTDALVIGVAARLSPEKGVDLFLQAAALIARQQPAVRFLVAGEGPEQAKLTELIVELGLGDRVQLAGRQRDMAAFYRQLDLLVLPSRTEGLPMALLEAMASGLPVVATKVGAMPRVVLEGETGHLVDANDPAAIAAAVQRLLTQPEQLLIMGEKARNRVRAEFSAQAMALQYVELYRTAGSLPLSPVSPAPEGIVP